MAILDREDYDWFIYNAQRGKKLTSSRGKVFLLKKGERFGVRVATGKKNVFRLVVDSLGLSSIFTFSSSEIEKILKVSRPAMKMYAQKMTMKKDGELKKQSIKKESSKKFEVDTSLEGRLQDVSPRYFWQVVEAIDWKNLKKTSGDPVSLCCKALLSVYSTKEVADLQKKGMSFARKLEKQIEKLEKKHQKRLFMGWDDDLFDACGAAVALGKYSFEKMLEDPMLFIEAFDKPESYEDSFLYSFDPHGDVIN